MFGISGSELLIVAVFALFIFGPDKLPEIGKTVGKAMRMFKDAQDDMERVIRAEMYAENDKAATAAAEKLRESAQPASTSATAVSAWATDEDEEEEEEE